ncbi:aldehyde dehydrogenase [Chelatococcus asaccharovorans]|uniref:Gamma-glutamyl-gamma-aminobutyraldehyde dehydrogenase n=1 Tax=Chelatococcus asaccharovorans TaxID=28210 RepID=A0A2V3UGT5_9HYPH|nr:aldehyde dehydrogenase [Chelatococcus asaccharovorans]MBS7701821.1 aldehyde dehydrogenase [Chelatococcus asaccharovorans]PXW64471.1 gamma-glutamyl-gamma-aminobutyraldehyde dehydrogenase [Chelatococcus asaccharovorans]
MTCQPSPRHHPDWADAARAVRIETRAFIDGSYTEASDGATFDCINPATGAVLGRVASCSAADVDRAVAAARRSFDAGDWSRCDPAVRRRALIRLADLIEEHRDTLAILETLDTGKLIRDSATLDIPGSADVFRFFGEACDKLLDEAVPVGPGALAMITREPVGVVGAVVPWNFPLKMAAWKCAPALAAGNSVLLKPAEQSPLTALHLAGLAAEAGIPPGVFNVLPGFGPDAGGPIGLHPDVDCVGFTGSTEVGKLFLGYAGRSNMKRVWLECGGKSAFIVCPDAGDLKAAAEAAAAGIFFNQGEVCSATSRLFVHEDIQADFTALLLDAAQAYAPGNPLDLASGMGAMVSEEQTGRVLSYIETGKAEADLLCGGSRVLAETGGSFIAPTIFTHVDPRAVIATEEIFGPVLSVISFRNEADVVGLANASIYGLGASIWTRDLDRAVRMSRALHVGSVSVNAVDHVDLRTPFGGVKQSGNGRDLSLHAFEKYLDLKTTWISIRETAA